MFTPFRWEDSRISIKLILENNSFCFNDTYFLQTKGTAMGTKFAPVYATLVLAYLEEKMYEKSEEDFNQTFRSYLEINFKRFLDDCFLILWIRKCSRELNFR